MSRQASQSVSLSRVRQVPMHTGARHPARRSACLTQGSVLLCQAAISAQVLEPADLKFTASAETRCACAGEPVVAKKVVCMHEEDHGLLWKHVEYRSACRLSARQAAVCVACSQCLRLRARCAPLPCTATGASVSHSSSKARKRRQLRVAA